MGYSTVADVSKYLRITIDATTTPTADTVEDYIDAADDAINRITKNRFEPTTSTDEILDVNTDTLISTADLYDSTSPYDLPTYNALRLKEINVQSITSVFYNEALPGETASWVEKDVGIGGDVLLHENKYILFIGDTPRAGIASVKCTYVYGEATVSPMVKELSALMAAEYVLASSSANTVSSGGGSIRIGDISLGESNQYTLKFLSDTQDKIRETTNKLGVINTYTI